MTRFSACSGCAMTPTTCVTGRRLRKALEGMFVSYVRHKCAERVPLYQPGAAVLIRTRPYNQSHREGGCVMRKDATISPCGLYRYRLTRIWDDMPWPLMPFVMLNPSTADADNDDPTIRRCIGFAKLHGYAGIDIANLYAFRATKPDDLCKTKDPYGPDNDAALMSLASHAVSNAVPIVCAWGARGGKSNRPIVLMQQVGAQLRCLGRTKGGQPRHPLYVRADQPFEEYP